MDLPLVGLGTWQLKGKACTKAVLEAIEIGYRHIDTAHIYENHKDVGKGIKEFDRENLFLTSKISLDQVNPSKVEESVEKACNLALKELGTDYIDLYLIHWPDRKFPLVKIFQAMEKLASKGKILQAGVSNFTIHHLQDLLEAGCKPKANQVEFHPHLYQKDLLEFCHKEKIKLISFRSLGKGQLLNEPVFEKIGLKHDKSAAQVILRWLIQKKIPVIPKASSLEHLKENIDIFDFSLTESEMKKLDSLNMDKRFCMPDEPEFNY